MRMILLIVILAGALAGQTTQTCMIPVPCPDGHEVNERCECVLDDKSRIAALEKRVADLEKVADKLLAIIKLNTESLRVIQGLLPQPLSCRKDGKEVPCESLRRSY